MDGLTVLALGLVALAVFGMLAAAFGEDSRDDVEDWQRLEHLSPGAI